MSRAHDGWLREFAAAAERTDRFVGRPDHVALLAAGLIGEAGSVVAELKKERREREAYPVYRNRMVEEVGDFLWYFVRLVTLVEPALIEEFQRDQRPETDKSENSPQLSQFLEFGVVVGDVLRTIVDVNSASAEHQRARLRGVWNQLMKVSGESGITLHEAAASNSQKIASRWPKEKTYCPLFDDGFPEEEQLPRILKIEFKERPRGSQKAVILRCNGINLGDRLTDNIEDLDDYRYHDVFHMSHAVFLGWSPVMRSLLRCKRKSDPNIDENQDGARATIVEEAVSATVFSRAKHMRFFDNSSRVDFDLLKSIQQFVQGYEIEEVPLWQWEEAILEGYRVFRQLRANKGGVASWDFARRSLQWSPLP